MANTSSFSNSFSQRVLRELEGPTILSENNFARSFDRKFPKVDQKLDDIYKNGLQGLDSPESVFTPVTPSEPSPDTSQASSWTFVTAPANIDWSTTNQASRVDIFGTNNPPVVSGSRGMRDLTISNALVEGFVRGVTVEGKIAALESLLDYKLNPSDGFVSVPVYQFWANNKSYGGANGYFVIQSVKVQEVMRDTTGNSTRAYVDLSLMQVPAYQVNSGRDQASKVTAGNVSVAPPSQSVDQDLTADTRSGANAASP